MLLYNSENLQYASYAEMIEINIVAWTVLALARWGANGGHNSSWGPQLRILLVYLSESLGRLGQNRGPLGGHIFDWGRGPSAPPPCRTARV